MKRIVLAGVAVLALAGAQSASAALVAEATDSSSTPIASAGGWLYAPSHVRISVVSEPSALLRLSVDLQCSRDNVDRRLQRDLEPLEGPIARSLKLPMPHPDSCYVDVTAYYEDFEQEGMITAKVFGHGKLHPY